MRLSSSDLLSGLLPVSFAKKISRNVMLSLIPNSIDSKRRLMWVMGFNFFKIFSRSEGYFSKLSSLRTWSRYSWPPNTGTYSKLPTLMSCSNIESYWVLFLISDSLPGKPIICNWFPYAVKNKAVARLAFIFLIIPILNWFLSKFNSFKQYQPTIKLVRLLLLGCGNKKYKLN